MADEQKTEKSRSELFLDILRERQKAQGKTSLLGNRQARFQQVRNQGSGDKDKRSRLKSRLVSDTSHVGSSSQPTAGPPKGPARIRPKF